MSVSLKKVGGFAFGAGVAVAAFVEILGRCLNAMNVHPGMWLSTVVICLWPTGIALNESSENWAGYIAFFIAATANGLLYALTAVSVFCFARFVKT